PPVFLGGGRARAASGGRAGGAGVGSAATGRPPFGTGPYEGIFYRIMNGQANLAGAPAALLPLLAAALARDPAHRPPAVQLRAQATVLDPGALVQYPIQSGEQAGPMPAAGAGATRSDSPSAPVAGAPGAHPPPPPPARGPPGVPAPPPPAAPGERGAGPPPPPAPPAPRAPPPP